MPDTKRTKAALAALLADNAAGNISEQDIRDFLESVFPTAVGASGLISTPANMAQEWMYQGT